MLQTIYSITSFLLGCLIVTDPGVPAVVEPRAPYATESGVSITDPRVPAVTEPTAPSALNREFVLSSTQHVLLSLSFLWWTTSSSVVLLNVLGCRSTY